MCVVHTFFLDKTGLKCGLPADKEICLQLLRFFSPPDRRPTRSNTAEEPRRRKADQRRGCWGFLERATCSRCGRRTVTAGERGSEAGGGEVKTCC